MKYLAITFGIITMMLFSSNDLHAQREVIEDTLIVKGVCGMCKERIEEAAYGKGVKFVNWNRDNDQLAIAYRADKTSIKEVEDRILKAGHSTGNQKATDDAYNSLPMCCRYEEKEKH